MLEWKHLIKIQHLYIYTEFCFLCQVLLMLGGWNSLTCLHLGLAKASPFPGVLAKLVEQGFYLIRRVTMAWGPLDGECQEFHSICVQDGIVTPKINTWNSTPISHPLCCELAVSGMKRGGIGEVVVGHVFLATLVWSVPPHPECWHWCPHTLIPLHWTFYLLSSKEALRNIQMNAQNLLFTHPRGVSYVWCWASNGKFTLFGTSQSHSSPEFVSLGCWWCIWPT